MKKWEIIREAKMYLAKDHKDEYDNKKCEYVCWAIGRVKRGEFHDQKNQIYKDVESWLKGEVTYGCWLLKFGKVSHKEYAKDDDNGYPKRQAGRLAWMNWMEEHYKSLDQ